MEFRDALKTLRTELGVTQTELAGILQVSISTVNRWELGRTCPNRSAAKYMLDYAARNGVSNGCIEELKASLITKKREKLDEGGGSLSAVEHASLRQLIDDAAFPLYVSDIENDEILYLNRKAKEMISGEAEARPSNKCFACIMKQDERCAFCHRNELAEDHYSCFEVVRPIDNAVYRVYGKKIMWRGRKAQAHYVVLEPGRVSADEKQLH